MSQILLEMHRAPWKSLEFCVGQSEKKDMKQCIKRKKILVEMNHAFIYGYVAFAIGILSLIILVVYTWRSL
jgi:hypothetical protein